MDDALQTNPARIRSEQSGGAAAAWSGSGGQRSSGESVPVPVPVSVPVLVPLDGPSEQGRETATFPFGQLRSHSHPKWLRA